ncbi:hypothetical protein GCK72_008527 [Caenorhabditis remanei]|uniref:C2H2-type domain-containing protein n=1 Tax=Caenorhabditis remanei TaxID=31234 RepID=A0A6A5GXT4_CAERE|nr:hypothetical protein GCK72_008527 [Caenorhabditis remanei]KAF1760280.1 hypothetical protein GCK72_008527 [Caenorhabditis remanei]
MTNKSEKPGGNDSGGGSGSKRRRGKKGKNTPSDSQSTASSSKTTSPKMQNQKQKQPEPSSSSTPKIQILKRDPSKNVTMPIVACVMPLMEVNLSDPPQPQPPTTPKYHQNPPSTKTQNQRIYQTPEKSEKSGGGMNTRRSEANKQQTQAYYFSQNPGVAVSGDKFKQPSQYKMHNFPLEKLVNIFIDGKYSLMITPTNSRCNGLFIRVESQHQDYKPTGALLSLDSDDETIRNACLETIERFDKVTQKSATDRYPYSKCSEPYLKSCLIKRLDDRLDAFPDAIYYCEKCDYHISTMGHARSHLESSSHFDDIKRQEQREHLVRHIPKPSKNHLRSIRKLLDDVLDDYKKVQEIGNEKASHILYYLQTTVFPAAIGGNRNVQLRPFGSATYDTVMPDSDYNVAYTMDLPENEPIFSMLEKVRKRIVDDGHPADHSMEMGTPSTILFTFEGVRVRLCWMSCFNYRSQLYFTDLMKTYVSLREEVVHFLQLIRLWACKAGVDSKNKPRIGLPRYGFDIMAIHFLQNQGLLPILHEMYEEDKRWNSMSNR